MTSPSRTVIDLRCPVCSYEFDKADLREAVAAIRKKGSTADLDARDRELAERGSRPR